MGYNLLKLENYSLLFVYVNFLNYCLKKSSEDFTFKSPFPSPIICTRKVKVSTNLSHMVRLLKSFPQNIPVLNLTSLLRPHYWFQIRVSTNRNLNHISEDDESLQCNITNYSIVNLWKIFF